MNAVTSKMVRTKLLVQSSTKTEKKKTHTHKAEDKDIQSAHSFAFHCAFALPQICAQRNWSHLGAA